MNELVKVSNMSVDDHHLPVLEFPNRPKAILDRHVAKIFNVETRRVNEVFTRNPDHFPDDFFFVLDKKEFSEVVANCDMLGVDQKIKYCKTPPRAFTQEGCNMIATLLKSKIATRRSVQIIRGFTAMEKRVDSMEQRFGHMPLFQVMKSCLENSEELKRQNDLLMGHDQKIGVIEKKVEHISDDRYWCVAGYAKCLNKKLTKDDISFITFEAKRQSSRMGYRLKFKPHDQYGKINRYHEEALIAAFDAWEKYVHNGQMELFG